ncbi:MAG: tetratricopeptide repeat protein [Candidatus Cloacimonetes bacterium]|nr:tetratricopeptide repeat protein [Candidatus Cloacimonadota bacterium]
MKKIFIVIIVFLIVGILFGGSKKPPAVSSQNLYAKENLVIIGFQALDSGSRTPLNLIERRDLGTIFSQSNHFNLIMGREVQNAMRDLRISSNMDNLSSEEASQIGERLDASMVVWGTIVSMSNTQFRMTGTMQSMRTGNVQSFSIVLDRGNNIEHIRAGLYDRASEFSRSEIGRIYEMALQHFHNRNYESAESMFLRLVSLDRENVDAYYYLGFMQFEQNRFSQAAEYYNQGLELDPESETLLLSLANAYRRQGMRNQAIEALEKVAENRSDVLLYYNIAILYNETGSIENAMEVLDRALSINPEYEEAHKLYAEIAYDNRMFEKAIEHLLIVTEMDPEDEESSRRLALSYQRTGQLDRAIERYLAIIASDSSNSRAYLNLANAYRAMALELPNDAQRLNRQALQAFEEALRLNQENARIEISIADVYLALNDFNNSERFANAAMRRQDGLHEASVILGTITQRRGIERYNSFVELQTLTDSGNLWGQELNETIARRDRTRAEAHALFNQSERHFREAIAKTDNERIRNDINQRIQANQQYVNMTRPDFFND